MLCDFVWCVFEKRDSLRTLKVVYKSPSVDCMPELELSCAGLSFGSPRMSIMRRVSLPPTHPTEPRLNPSRSLFFSVWFASVKQLECPDPPRAAQVRPGNFGRPYVGVESEPPTTARIHPELPGGQRWRSQIQTRQNICSVFA